ncbi:prevent-host-death protein [Streptomyces avicenniae]|uniref:prevent-host-death protein n=1 Tax=Streptomyces avicenniae TaxID=500153 RepID=UPI00167DEA0F|nr:prevent-host-death protein [Streptomyces avicenniae]
MEENDLPDRVDEADLPEVLTRVLDRSARGGATVITRGGEAIGAVVSMNDYNVVEDEIDRRFAERERPPDDGTRHALDGLMAGVESQR